MTSLKVDNLTYRTSDEDLKYLFNKYGEVGDVYIPRVRLLKVYFLTFESVNR